MKAQLEAKLTEAELVRNAAWDAYKHADRELEEATKIEANRLAPLTKKMYLAREAWYAAQRQAESLRFALSLDLTAPEGK